MRYSGSGSMTKILSVSVATYNASKNIEQCLDSFINSKYVRLGISRILGKVRLYTTTICCYSVTLIWLLCQRSGALRRH